MKSRLIVLLGLFWLIAAPAGAAAPAVEPGQLLVARDALPDVRFREAVVLVVQQGPEGTAGLILNRPSRLSLAEVLPDLPIPAGEAHPLFYGGPVAPKELVVLVMAADNPPDPAQKVLDAVYLTGPAELAAWLAGRRPGAGYRVFAGHAGWAPGQLAGELNNGDWRVLPAEADLPFSSDVAGMWQKFAEESER